MANIYKKIKPVSVMSEKVLYLIFFYIIYLYVLFSIKFLGIIYIFLLDNIIR